jgi:hypothetical protein
MSHVPLKEHSFCQENYGKDTEKQRGIAAQIGCPPFLRCSRLLGSLTEAAHGIRGKVALHPGQLVEMQEETVVAQQAQEHTSG